MLLIRFFLPALLLVLGQSMGLAQDLRSPKSIT